MGIISRKTLLAGIFTVVVTAKALAQSSKQKPTLGELQKQLEKTRSQMVRMRNRIAELEAPLPLLIWTSASPMHPSPGAPRESQALPSNTLHIP
jgi:hypothetical protein